MKEFSLEVLNTGRSENVCLLSKEEMNEVWGGDVECGKGFSMKNDGSIACGCNYSSSNPPIIIWPPKPLPDGLGSPTLP